LYVLKVNGKFGAIDRFGQSRVEARFEYLGSFKKGVAAYRESDFYGFVDLNGYVHKAEFDWISEFDEWKLAIFRKANKFGLIDRKGRVHLEADFDQVLRADKGIYVVVEGTHYGFYSAEGCFISSLEYDYQKEKPIDYYTQDRWFRLLKNKNVALMDENGALRVNYGVYEDCGFFKNGLLCVKKKKKYGYVDRKLQTAIPYFYTQAGDFKDSVALVKRGELFEAIHLNGNTLFSSTQAIQRLDKHHFLKSDNGTISLMNAKAEVLLESIDHHEALASGYFLFTLKSGDIKLLKL
jgi:hypothetical protein